MAAWNERYPPITVTGGGGTGGSIATLSDVLITSLANGQLLKYNSTSSKWVNVSIGASSGIQAYNANTVIDAAYVHTDNNYTNTDAIKLAGLTNYTHPANHAPSIITQDASNRFVTDVQITAWNGKQAALGFTPENVSNKGVVNGYAGLDSGGKVPAAQLPAYVDDVLEYANFAALPGTGSTGVIYVTIDNNKTFRWSGSAYVEISPSPGSTDSITEGSTNLYFTESRVRSTVLSGISFVTNAAITAADTVLSAFGKIQKQITDHIANVSNPHSVTKSQVGLGNVDNTSNATERAATATLTNKTLNLTSNSLSGTKAQFDTAVSNDNFAYVGQSNTFTANQTITGNLNLSGFSRKILGNFSDVTQSNRTVFQSNVTDGATVIGLIPNGTSRVSAFKVSNGSDIVNASHCNVLATDVSCRIESNALGTGAFLPLEFHTGTFPRMHIDALGHVGINCVPSGSYNFEINGSSSFAGSLDVSSTLTTGAGMVSGKGVSTDDVVYEMGLLRTGDGNCYIDIHSTPGTDFESRILRLAGANGAFQIANTGTGNFDISQNGAGAINFNTADTTRLKITSTGDVLAVSTGLGYGTGAGGTVTQIGSRSTDVTLSKPTGNITLVSAAGSATWQTFVVTNTLIGAYDTVVVSQKSGTDKYLIFVTNINAGSGFSITFATTGGTTTEQPVFNFAIIKGTAT